MTRRPDRRILLPRTGDEPPTLGERAGWSALYSAAGGKPVGELGRAVRAQMDGWKGSESTQSNDRAPPVAHERAEQIALTRAVRTRWYAPGYRHIEQAVATGSDAQARAGSRNRKAGVLPGVLDTELKIPRTVDEPAIVCVLELKRPDLKPKRNADAFWWLDWVPEHERSTRHGLSGSQWWSLMLAVQCDMGAYVAYGAAEALAYFDDVAGPEREVHWPKYAIERRGLWVG